MYGISDIREKGSAHNSLHEPPGFAKVVEIVDVVIVVDKAQSSYLT